MNSGCPLTASDCPGCLRITEEQRGRLGHGEISSVCTLDSAVSAEDKGPGGCACVSLLQIASFLTLTCWANLAWSACTMFVHQSSKTQDAGPAPAMGFLVGVILRTQEAAMWEGRAIENSGKFQVNCGRYYPGSILLRLLPVYELFCWTFDLPDP